MCQSISASASTIGASTYTHADFQELMLEMFMATSHVLPSALCWRWPSEYLEAPCCGGKHPAGGATGLWRGRLPAAFEIPVPEVAKLSALLELRAAVLQTQT